MGKNLHVVPHDDQWGVRGEGNSRLTSINDTQAEAIEVARQIARNQQSELFIHGRHGRIRDSTESCRRAGTQKHENVGRTLGPQPDPQVRLLPGRGPGAGWEPAPHFQERDSFGGDPFPPRDRKH